MLPLFPFEIAFSVWIQTFMSVARTEWMILFSWLGSPVFWGGVILCLYWTHRRAWALRVLVVTMLAGALSEGLKTLVKRPRPLAEQGIQLLYGDGVGEYGFPSGHATLASAQFNFLGRTVSMTFFQKWVGVFLLLMVGLSRVYLGMHFIGDVIAGLALGGILGAVLPKLLRAHVLVEKVRARESEILVGLVSIFAFGLFFISPESRLYAAGILGFVAGFALYEDASYRAPLALNRRTGFKLGVGILSTGYLAWETYVQIVQVPGFEIVAFAAFFLVGVWATFFFPTLWERFFEPPQRHPRSKRRR